ncbi:hypothetical protein Y1Q_0018033 [Alligator mississippiensis]|uniref:Uncharacterized protein n=1 Tax=Alligator mississippiensis TaxID=8496 RepID=A0A151MY26_ALLMI|nr:hypothetical protein Y1Q_0018033 [Alligator mississippiensis]
MVEEMSPAGTEWEGQRIPWCLSSTSDHGRPLCTPKEYIAEEPGQPDRWFLYYIMLGFITSYRPGKSKSPGKPGSLDITQLVLNKI